MTEDWLKLRRSGIGGSDVAAIVGLSPYRTSFDVWLSKTEDFQESDNKSMQRGRHLEAGVISWYEEITGNSVQENKEIHRLPDNPIVLGTPDGFFADKNTGEKCLLEVKTVHFSQARHWGEVGTDAVPDYYLAQVIWYLGITGLQRADVVALIGGDDLRVYTVRFDAALFAMLVEKANVFWNSHVVTKTPPEIDNSDGAREWLDARFPKEKTQKLKQDDALVRKIIFDLREMEIEKKSLEDRIDTAKNRVKEYIGDDSGVTGPWGRITWKNYADSFSLDGEAALAYLVSTGAVTAEEAKKAAEKSQKRRKGGRRFISKFD